MKYKVSEPKTLLAALNELFPDSSNSTLRKLLKNKRVMVGKDIVVNANYLLSEGEEFAIVTPIVKTPLGLSILYQDKDIVVINKPEGMLSVPLDKGEAIHALGVLRKHFDTKEIYVVHRIDRETSGVMIFARNEEAKTYLLEMFKKHDFHRVYLAVAKGNMREESGTWKSRLVELSNLDVVRTEDPTIGQEAITHFRVIRRVEGLTYLELTLETGKKHQIRVHCKDSGHPILGDKRYGAFEVGVRRMMLHAYQLEFIHPFTQKQMSFTARIPGAFDKLVGGLPESK